MLKAFILCLEIGEEEVKEYFRGKQGEDEEMGKVTRAREAQLLQVVRFAYEK